MNEFVYLHNQQDTAICHKWMTIATCTLTLYMYMYNCTYWYLFSIVTWKVFAECATKLRNPRQGFFLEYPNREDFYVTRDVKIAERSREKQIKRRCVAIFANHLFVAYIAVLHHMYIYVKVANCQLVPKHGVLDKKDRFILTI